MTEIITSAERAATAEAEPRLTLTELQGLLRDAAALGRAQRPIVLRTAAETAATAITLPTTAGFAPPLHPGIDVTVQAEPGVGWAVLRHPEPVRRGWGVMATYASMLTVLVGAAGATVTDGNAATVVAIAAGLAGTVAGIARAVTEQNRGR